MRAPVGEQDVGALAQRFEQLRPLALHQARVAGGEHHQRARTVGDLYSARYAGCCIGHLRCKVHL